MAEKYAKRNGLEITDYITDEMKTGTNQNREGFQKLLHLVEEGLVDVIIVAYFDRLGRNSIQMSSFLMKLKDKGIECISVGQNKRLSLMSEKDVVQEAIYAEAENINRKNRLGSSQRDSLRSGEFAYGAPPTGYDKTKDRRLVPNKDAEFVRMLFHLYLQYEKLSEVIKYVRHSEEWKHMNLSSQGLRTILTNKVYLGNIYRREKNEDGSNIQKLYASKSHLAIIDEETFEEVGKLLNKNIKGDKKVNFHLFSGILLCGKCGNVLYGYPNRYKCKTVSCNTLVHKKDIEPQILALLQIKADNENSLKEKYDSVIRDIKNQQEKLEMDYATLKISKERLKERLFHLDQEMQKAYEDYINKAFKIGNYKELIENKQFKELKDLILKRGLKIEILTEGKMKFTFRIIE